MKGIQLSNHEPPVFTRIKGEENDRLETDVRSTSSCINTIDHVVLRGSSAGVVPILEQYRISFSISFFPQPQFWHLQYGTWATCIQTVGVTLHPSRNRSLNASTRIM